MEIFGSAQYVGSKTRETNWYQLYVINQWDFKSHAVCFSYVKDIIIYYSLRLSTPTSNDSYKSEEITKLTKEMKKVIVSNGYFIM